jgi:hypothetical protein
MRLVDTGRALNVHASTMPVSPMPPTVAQNRPVGSLGVTSRTDPSAIRIVIDSMWSPQDPSM